MLPSLTLTCLSGNIGFLQLVVTVTFEGFRFLVIMIVLGMYCFFFFFCNPIRQLCLGDPVYSSRNVNEIITAFVPSLLLPLLKTC